MIEQYPKLTFSEMAAEDMDALVLEPEKLATLHNSLTALSGFKAHILTDMPRDGRNFIWRGAGMVGGLIDHGDEYQLHS